MTEQLNNKVSETTMVSGTDSWQSMWALSRFQLMSLLIVIGAQQTTFKPSNIKTTVLLSLWNSDGMVGTFYPAPRCPKPLERRFKG